MQKQLRDILSDPPHGLGTVANILLLFSIVLLGSIFFIDSKESDVILNLEFAKSTITFVESKNQVAKRNYTKLYALAKEGDVVEKSDTLFSTLSKLDLATLNSWKNLLSSSKLTPTKNMIEMPFVDEAVRSKMIDLAKIKTPPKKVDYKRMQQLKADVSELNNSIENYNQAIAKFKVLDKQYRKEFSRAKEEYEDGSLSLTQLTKAKRKVDENNANLLQRERELESENLLLFNANSELEYIRKSNAANIKKGSDNTFHEADLMYGLDSLIQSSFVIASYNGRLEKIGSLENVSQGDVLATYAEEEIQSNRSNRLIASVIDPKDVNKFIPGRELFIFLKDGSRVTGEVLNLNNETEGQVEILSKEELSDMDVDHIILPAKNENFIEKVLENF